MKKPRAPVQLHIRCGLIVGLLTGTVAAQDAETKYKTWNQVEAATETREYRDGVRGGGAFDDKARAFATQMVLPQLGLDENRPTIERIRKRVRELLLNDILDEKAYEAAGKTIVDSMAALARNADAEPVVRVNAMLLVGELRTKDNRPLPAAAAPLAAAAGDPRLPLEIRVAAAAGLARHADAAKAAGTAADLAKVTASALPPMLTMTGEGGQSPGADWLAARACAILQTLGPPAASKESLEAAARILGDPTRAIDARIRAAAAVGAVAKPGASFDAARAVESIRAVAIAALEADEAAASERRFAKSLSDPTAAAPGTVPGAAAAEPAIPQLVCRRDAWRLATCADAILAEDGASGLALLLGNDAASAKSLAATLRTAAKGLDANPDEQSLLDALAALGKPVAGGRAAGRPTVQPGAEPGKPDVPATNDTPSPFDSPFGK